MKYQRENPSDISMSPLRRHLSKFPVATQREDLISCPISPIYRNPYTLPVNTSSAGPVIYTWLSASSHSMNKSPPLSETVASRSDKPLSTEETNVAQAPVPHASVGPAPRSHTRISVKTRSRTV